MPSNLSLTFLLFFFRYVHWPSYNFIFICKTCKASITFPIALVSTILICPYLSSKNIIETSYLFYLFYLTNFYQTKNSEENFIYTSPLLFPLPIIYLWNVMSCHGNGNPKRDRASNILSKGNWGMRQCCCRCLWYMVCISQRVLALWWIVASHVFQFNKLNRSCLLIYIYWVNIKPNLISENKCLINSIKK